MMKNYCLLCKLYRSRFPRYKLCMIVTLKTDKAEIKEALRKLSVELSFSVDSKNLQCTPVSQGQKLMLHWSSTIRVSDEASKGVCSPHIS